MTAQDQQSREEFEAFWRKEMNVEAMDLARTNYPMTPQEKQQYLCHETNRSWLTWQAARALPAGIKPVAVASMPFCRLEWMIGETVSAEEVAEISRQGARLYTAAQVQTMGRVPPGFVAVPVLPTEDIPVGNDGTPSYLTQMFGPGPTPRPPAAQEGAA